MKRPTCPIGHVGRIWLDGRKISGKGRFERTRFRCVPDEDRDYARQRKHGPNEHVFLAPRPARREAGTSSECGHCERPFARNEGLAGGWRFPFVVQEIAAALERVGQGATYRATSRELRASIGRRSARGKRQGKVPINGALVMDWMDVFGPDIVGTFAPSRWPRIVALDAFAIRVRDHSECCKNRILEGGLRRSRHPGPDAVRDASGYVRHPKIRHPAPVRETGRVLVAVGYEHPGAAPRPWLVRFAGGGDQESWDEFLRSLEGAPEWVVSDRDGAIAGAVSAVWGSATHYFCEQHIADNAAEAARKDGLEPRDGVLKDILEQMQYGPEEYGRAEGAARAFASPTLIEWLERNRDLVLGQVAKREGKGLNPRSAGATESVISAVQHAIEDREPYFANADRLNLLLALLRIHLDGKASAAAYSRVIRARLAKAGGRSEADWTVLRDRDGYISSIEMLLADCAERARQAETRRRAPGKAECYRERKALYDAERAVLGWEKAPRGRPRVERAAPGSVAGKHVSDFGWLLAEWDHTKNMPLGLEPETTPAGSGLLAWWRCWAGPDHSWQAQVRSRSVRGVGCPFCMHRNVAPSEALSKTHPDLAAQWHPTRNGTKLPSDFTYGSHFEAWWQCPVYKSHVWRTRISSRTSMLANCPQCYELAQRGVRLPAPRQDAKAS